MRFIFLAIFSICLFVNGWTQQVEKPESGTFLLKNGTIVSVTNGTFQGDLLIRDGMITEIGENLSQPEGAVLIDCTHRFVYPGFIDAGTRLGLSEVGSISLTQDYSELGDFTPQMKALTAVNPNSVAIPVTRTNGITTVLVSPSGGIFSGTASLIDLIGYTPEQMYAGFDGVVLNFPSTGRRGRRDSRSAEDRQKEEERAVKRLNELWDKAVLHAKLVAENDGERTQNQGYNPELDAMIGVVQGEVPLLVEVDRDKDILSAIKWIKEKKVKAVLSGVSEGWRVADSIAAADLPVITGPVLSIPTRASDPYDAAYANAGKMKDAGVKVAIRTNEIENVRNLPFNAGFAAAYGLGKEEALKAITIYPAEIFNVDDKYGSLEEGKVANVFVSDGDPFETNTHILHLFIKGWKVALESRQTLLYHEFLERKPGLESNE